MQADKSSILSTKKKVLLGQKETSLSRKSSLTSCITKPTINSVAKALKKASEARDQQLISFQPTFTFQNVDLSCLDEQFIAERVTETISINFPGETTDRKFGIRSPFYERLDPPKEETNSPEPFLIPSAHYLSKFSSKETSITLTMRAVLLNWIAEVTELFMYKREVFHSAVSYLDRYLDAIDLRMEKSKFQLLGLVCLYMACKFEVNFSFS